MISGGDFAPFTQAMDKGIWMYSVDTQQLHAAAVGLFADTHPYATATQVQALNGQVVTLRRGLPKQHDAYPPISTPVSMVYDQKHQDPYQYRLTRYAPESTELRGMTIQHWDPTISAVSATRFIVTAGDEIPEVALSQAATIAEVEAMAAVLHTGIPNTSESASLMRWSEVLGAEAEAFQAVVDRLLEAAGVIPGPLSYPVCAEVKEVVAGRWAVEGATINSGYPPDRRVNGLGVGAALTFEETDLILATRGIYIAADEDKFVRTALVVQFAGADGEQEFLTGTERMAALDAIDLQLQPGNLNILHINPER